MDRANVGDGDWAGEVVTRIRHDDVAVWQDSSVETKAAAAGRTRDVDLRRRECQEMPPASSIAAVTILVRRNKVVLITS